MAEVTLFISHLIMMHVEPTSCCTIISGICHRSSQHGSGMHTCGQIAFVAKVSFHGCHGTYAACLQEQGWACGGAINALLHSTCIVTIPHKTELFCCRISGVVNTGKHLASEPLTAAMHMLDLRPHQPHFMYTMALACRSLRETEQALFAGYANGSLQSIDASELPYPLR